MSYDDISKFIEYTSFDIQRVEVYGYTITIFFKMGRLKEFSFKVLSTIEGSVFLSLLIEKYDLRQNPTCEHQYFPREFFENKKNSN